MGVHTHLDPLACLAHQDPDDVAAERLFEGSGPVGSVRRADLMGAG